MLFIYLLVGEGRRAFAFLDKIDFLIVNGEKLKDFGNFGIIIFACRMQKLLIEIR